MNDIPPKNVERFEGDKDPNSALYLPLTKTGLLASTGIKPRTLILFSIT